MQKQQKCLESTRAIIKICVSDGGDQISSFQTSSCLGNSLNLVCTLVTVVKILEHTKKAREYEIPQHVLTIQFDVVLISNHSMYMNFTHAHEFVRLQTTTE